MLEHLAVNDPPLEELVIVDNSPSRVNRSAVDNYAAIGRVKYIPSTENLGYSGGIALGISHVLKYADADDWIALLDDEDPPHSPHLLSTIKEFGEEMLNQDANTAGVALTGARFDWKRARITSIEDEELGVPLSVDYLPGGQFAIYRVHVLRETGSFNRDLFLGYVDLEYGLRLRAQGYSLYAHGALWQARIDGRRPRVARRATLGLPQDKRSAAWRRYYALRNLIFIARTRGHRLQALRITLERGLLKPLLNFPVHPIHAGKLLRANWRACIHGWRGKLGRTINPD